MAILGKVAGSMLKDNLLRLGVDLQVDTDLMYFDMTNRRVGINTTLPGNTFVANGNATLSNIYITNGNITALKGNLYLKSLNGNISANSQRITDLANPVSSTDAVNKNYVDSITNTLSANLTITDGTTTTNVYLHTDTLTFAGNTNQIVTAVSTDQVKISLNPNITINGNLVAGNVVSNNGLTGTVFTNAQPYINTLGTQTYFNATIGNTGNIQTNSNTISATNVDGNIILKPGANGTVQVSANTAIQIPYGDMTNRPINPLTGMTRWNTSLQEVEIYNGSTWVPISAQTVQTVLTSDVFTPTAGQTVFTLSQSSTTAGTLVSLNGVVQTPFTAYTVSGTTLTFLEPLLITDIVEARTIVSAQSLNGISNNTTSVITNDGNIVVSVNNAVTAYFTSNAMVRNSPNISAGSGGTLVDTFSTTSYRTARYTMSTSNATTYQSNELLIIHNGTTANIANLGAISTGSNLGSFTVSLTSGNVYVWANMNSTGNYIKYSKNLITI